MWDNISGNESVQGKLSEGTTTDCLPDYDTAQPALVYTEHLAPWGGPPTLWPYEPIIKA